MNTEVETLKQEFEGIQNNVLPKEETKLEEAFYTKNVEEWLKFINKVDFEHRTITHNIFDYEIIKNAEAFALGPVFSCNGKTEACSSIKYDSLKELKDFLKGKKYIMYCICFQVVTELIDKTDVKNLNIASEMPFYSIGKNPKLRILFRGHILE
jgi:hypothetical protein